MIQQIYTVYDAKALVHSQPFLAPNNNLAIRNFHATKSQPGTHINLFPSDFGLYHLGEFDDINGTFNMLEKPAFIMSASEL